MWAFLLEDTKVYKTIAQILEKTQILRRTTIPNRSILKATELKL